MAKVLTFVHDDNDDYVVFYSLCLSGEGVHSQSKGMERCRVAEWRERPGKAQLLPAVTADG